MAPVQMARGMDLKSTLHEAIALPAHAALHATLGGEPRLCWHVRILLTLIAVLFLLSGPAYAATIKTDSECDARYGSPCVTSVTFAAAPAARNEVTVSVDGGRIVLRDPGDTITSEDEPCTSNGPHEVSCPAPTSIRVKTGDGDDAVWLAAGGASTNVDLGPGDDTFAGDGNADGGEGDDRLIGGPGSDDLRGGPGRDRLDGAEGDDVIDVGDGDPDVADGGPGRDTLSYGAQLVGVSVDLGDRLPEGRPGEGDVVTGVEDIYGSSGDDALTGDDGPNTIRGSYGSDRVRGRGGDDVLIARLGGRNDNVPEKGSDRLFGGDGDVRLEAGRDQWTTVICGPGADTVRITQAKPARVSPTCERFTFNVNDDVGSLRFGRQLMRGRVLIVLRLRDPGRHELRLELNVEPPTFSP